MNTNERLEALRLLTQLLKRHTPLSMLIQNKTLTPFTKALCFGVCRYYIQLEAIADALLAKRPKEVEIWCCLLLGLYQLQHQKDPDYAVVKETVSLLDHVKKSSAKGFMNAILRRFCREQLLLTEKLQGNASYRYNHPHWFIESLKQAWPANWEAVLSENDRHPPMSLRVNIQKITVAAYLKQLASAGFSASPIPHTPYGIHLSIPCDVQALPGFSEGLVSIQDGAAQLATTLLDLKEGHRLLDACAAPGGKTCALLESTPNLMSCIALDLDPARLKRVQDNLNRLKLQATLIAGDATQPNLWWDKKPFDRILLDAPCSATGIIRRQPDIKLQRTAAQIKTASDLQQRLLNALWPLLAPGGILVYVTCSILPEENEQSIAQFVATHQDSAFLAEKSPEWGNATGHGWQLLPGEHTMDGFFYSALMKTDIS